MAKSPMTPFEFDRRMVEWNLKHKVISKDDLNGFVGNLPDEAANAEEIVIEDEAKEAATSEAAVEAAPTPTPEFPPQGQGDNGGGFNPLG